jgi:hypothetical protein
VLAWLESLYLGGTGPKNTADRILRLGMARKLEKQKA